jgi:hypothetical protein
MEVGIWSKKADNIMDFADKINSWISINERNGMTVVDKTTVMGAEDAGGSTYTSKSPWVTITVWMENNSKIIR